MAARLQMLVLRRDSHGYRTEHDSSLSTPLPTNGCNAQQLAEGWINIGTSCSTVHYLNDSQGRFKPFAMRQQLAEIGQKQA